MGSLKDFTARFDVNNSFEHEKTDPHSIRNRKYVKSRRIVGIIAGAAVAIAFASLAPCEMNVDAVGAACVGIGSGIIARGAWKMHQKKKLGIKKHTILKRVLYGKGEDRPTLPDKLFLAAAVAPTAILFATGASQAVIPMIVGITAYVAKRIYNYAKTKKDENTNGVTR